MALKTDRDQKQAGDVLGISNANPHATIDVPVPVHRGSGHPQGIEVRERATGIGDVHPSKGATGIDMGGGGTGTDVDPGSTRPLSSEDQEE